MMNWSQALGLIHATSFSRIDSIDILTSKLVLCFLTIRLTSLSLFLVCTSAQRLIPERCAAASPISDVTAWAVVICEEHEASAWHIGAEHQGFMQYLYDDRGDGIVAGKQQHAKISCLSNICTEKTQQLIFLFSKSTPVSIKVKTFPTPIGVEHHRTSGGIGGGVLKDLYTTYVRKGPSPSKSLPLESPPLNTFLHPFQPQIQRI